MTRWTPILMLASTLGCAGEDEPPADTAPDGDADTDVDTDTDADADACSVFPPDHPWNTDVSGDPVHPDSALFLAAMDDTLPLSVGSEAREHPVTHPPGPTGEHGSVAMPYRITNRTRPSARRPARGVTRVALGWRCWPEVQAFRSASRPPPPLDPAPRPR